MNVLPDKIFKWYTSQTKQFGVDSPKAVGYTSHDTRSTAIDLQAAWLESYYIPKPRAKVVEFGCGNLLTYDALLKLGMDRKAYTGIEIVPEFIEYAKSRKVKVLDSIPQNRKFHTGILADSFAAAKNRIHINEMITAIENICSDVLVLSFSTSKTESKTPYKFPSIDKLVDKYQNNIYIGFGGEQLRAVINLKQYRKDII